MHRRKGREGRKSGEEGGRERRRKGEEGRETASAWGIASEVVFCFTHEHAHTYARTSTCTHSHAHACIHMNMNIHPNIQHDKQKSIIKGGCLSDLMMHFTNHKSQQVSNGPIGALAIDFEVNAEQGASPGSKLKMSLYLKRNPPPPEADRPLTPCEIQQ